MADRSCQGYPQWRTQRLKLEPVDKEQAGRTTRLSDAFLSIAELAQELTPTSRGCRCQCRDFQGGAEDGPVGEAEGLEHDEVDEELLADDPEGEVLPDEVEAPERWRWSALTFQERIACLRVLHG